MYGSRRAMVFAGGPATGGRAPSCRKVTGDCDPALRVRVKNAEKHFRDESEVIQYVLFPAVHAHPFSRGVVETYTTSAN